MGKLAISMAMFNSYLDITRGYMCQFLPSNVANFWEIPEMEMLFMEKSDTLR